MSDAPSSRLTRAMTWLVLIVFVGLLLYGVAKHGFSASIRERFWSDMLGRVDGPMTFRFFLQPVMAFLAALPDGIGDAKRGRSAFFWSAWSHPGVRTGRLREGIGSTARVLLLGLCMDVIYQFRVFSEFYPVEALLMAVMLALVPYFLFRWIVERVSTCWFARSGPRNRA
jgi:hypothetical protein